MYKVLKTIPNRTKSPVRTGLSRVRFLQIPSEALSAAAEASNSWKLEKLQIELFGSVQFLIDTD